MSPTVLLLVAFALHLSGTSGFQYRGRNWRLYEHPLDTNHYLPGLKYPFDLQSDLTNGRDIKPGWISSRNSPTSLLQQQELLRMIASIRKRPVFDRSPVRGKETRPPLVDGGYPDSNGMTKQAYGEDSTTTLKVETLVEEYIKGEEKESSEMATTEEETDAATTDPITDIETGHLTGHPEWVTEDLTSGGLEKITTGHEKEISSTQAETEATASEQSSDVETGHPDTTQEARTSVKGNPESKGSETPTKSANTERTSTSKEYGTKPTSEATQAKRISSKTDHRILETSSTLSPIYPSRTSPTSRTIETSSLSEHVITMPRIRTARMVVTSVFLAIGLIAVAVLAVFMFRKRRQAAKYDQLKLLP